MRRARLARTVLVLFAAQLALLAVGSAGVGPDAPVTPSPAVASGRPPSSFAPAAPDVPAVNPPAPGPPSQAGAIVEAASAAEGSRSGVELGVAVVDLATGELTAGDGGDTGFNAASLTKVLTVADVLEGRTSGRATVDGADLDRVRAALGPSDDPAMNALWSDFGGSAGITRTIARLALADTTVPNDPSQWGEVRTSARDMARVFRAVVLDLAPADRDLVLAALREAPPTAADGFDQGYGLLEPETRGQAAAKQGWLCCLDAGIDLHSVGLLDERYVLALLTRQPYGYDAAREVLDDAARAARAATDG